MDRPLPRSRLSGLRLALLALLLFAMQPLLHAHALGRLPDGHVGGVHAPGADFANAAASTSMYRGGCSATEFPSSSDSSAGGSSRRIDCATT